MSRVGDFLFGLYQMGDTDRRALNSLILSTMTAAWRRGISDEAHAFGCPSAFGKPPAGSDLQALEALARQDTDSIVATFNRDLRRFIERLVEANPTVTDWRFFSGQLETWVTNRNGWKNAQIALNSEVRARDLGRRRFWEMNNVRGKFKAFPLTSVCPICVAIIAAGTVDQTYVDEHPLPAHINCTHEYRVVNAVPRTIPCDQMWVGG